MNQISHFRRVIRRGNFLNVVDLETGELMRVKVERNYHIGEIYFFGSYVGAKVVFSWSDSDQMFQGGLVS